MVEEQETYKMKAWISAFRPKTLPLAAASILWGSLLAYQNGKFSLPITLLALATAFSLQILSNLANDYGDFKKGTDNNKRLGPQRALQSGSLTEKSVLNSIWFFSILSLIFGLLLLYFAFEIFNWAFLLMFLLGLAAIWAAIKYTAGKNPYGYSALGDLSVFIFFGLIGVVGTYYLHTGNIHDTYVWLPAITCGALATGVLNINNTRDIKNDIANNKITLAGKLGRKNALLYQMALLIIAGFSFSWYLSQVWKHPVIMFSILGLMPALKGLQRMNKIKEGDEHLFNNELKVLSLSSLFLVILTFVCWRMQFFV